MTKDRTENTDIKTGETTPSVVRNPTNVKLEDGENDNQTAENQCLITADATPNELPSPSSSSSIPSASSSQNNSDTSRVTANKTESCPSQLDDDEDDADSKIKFEEEKFDCLPIPFDAPIPYNLSSNNDSNPTTRLSFEDDPARGSDSATLNYQENEDVGSPPPIGADGAFPTSCFEDMSIFPSFPNQYHIDDAYSTNLLGCTFLPSPNDSGNAMPSIAPQFHLNFHDIRAQYRGPTLSSSACNNINGHAFPNNPPPPPPFIRSLHSTDEDDDEEEGRIRRSSMGSSGGKSLDNLSQISARASRTNRSRRPRQTSRNLPLRKRHTSIDHNRDQQLMTTPLATTRSSRRMVSRSASAEKKKGRGMSSSMQIDTHRNWSKRHGSSTGNSARANSTKSFTRTSATSAARFNNVPTPTLSSASKITPRVRVIEHFTPKRNTKAILSKESALPNTVIIGCKCSKSKCLKLYCDCFQVGRVCADRCSCKNCLNTPAESGKNGRRTAAIQNILDRRPDAFDVRVKKIGQGCSCKKNKCLKKYCDCFNSGIKCDPVKCRCTDCQNYPMEDDDRHCDESSSISVADDEKDEISYDAEDTHFSDFQTPFHQDEYDHSSFDIHTSSTTLLDDKTPIFQDDDVAAV